MELTLNLELKEILAKFKDAKKLSSEYQMDQS